MESPPLSPAADQVSTLKKKNIALAAKLQSALRTQKQREEEYQANLATLQTQLADLQLKHQDLAQAEPPSTYPTVGGQEGEAQFQAERTQLETQLTEAQARLGDCKAQWDQERRTLLDRATDLADQLTTRPTTATLEALECELATARTQIAELKKRNIELTLRVKQAKKRDALSGSPTQSPVHQGDRAGPVSPPSSSQRRPTSSPSDQPPAVSLAQTDVVDLPSICTPLSGTDLAAATTTTIVETVMESEPLVSDLTPPMTSPKITATFEETPANSENTLQSALPAPASSPPAPLADPLLPEGNRPSAVDFFNSLAHQDPSPSEGLPPKGHGLSPQSQPEYSRDSPPTDPAASADIFVPADSPKLAAFSSAANHVSAKHDPFHLGETGLTTALLPPPAPLPDHPETAPPGEPLFSAPVLPLIYPCSVCENRTAFVI
ncbi:hypothetical protein H4R33_000771 [Dimargaris cristalligena]|uniref:Uncharacterized protein n=1 Tax=Dimargaris cristalligena TaxID=215637 RepID=A0A4P9ZRF0_9FUNG|nr:hypothetical protein H4R33_000771 [Dimargaris cristalligena]RKP35977.1 hypothetical protein BJ085DRAFT_35682 [Dimargaris cristalligena]|eukprot:RKP35977.1 hypothetical protein BJ085DRAFT_35682 [Dimargaris cristalligena]